ncbi:predicted protein [Uncinocarpus reesii 1704]|uniref:RRM domain-containing protein n=1 Tax=Uncinocarpus reesii (strain UAMH 1704) TaxID=336963 RepID=C4JVZ8_UNCRE|nr:uncharacterized protein UREG_06740 [Uncinocarpus reesii 1704]EEP81875.1 predicted protein [Uncinocarpus reesii 1704]
MATHRYPSSGPVPHFPQSNRSSISTSSNYSASSTFESTVPVSRHLFVQNLSPGTTTQQLKEYLTPAGTASRCDIVDQRSFGRTKVCATLSLQNEEEAKLAISMFDNSTFMGSRIRVRFNRERSGSGSSQPKQAPLDASKVGEGLKATAADTASSHDKPETADECLGGSRGEETGPGKKRGEPLVVNGSCVGMKAGRGNEEKRDYEGELSKRAQEIHL